MCRRSAVFQCPDAHCLHKKGQRIAGSLIQFMPRCHVCGREREELCRARDTGDQILGLLINPSALENPGSREFVRHQSTLVCFQGMLNHSIFYHFIMVNKYLRAVTNYKHRTSHFCRWINSRSGVGCPLWCSWCPDKWIFSSLECQALGVKYWSQNVLSRTYLISYASIDFCTSCWTLVC
jgi:hypothetical protein